MRRRKSVKTRRTTTPPPERQPPQSQYPAFLRNTVRGFLGSYDQLSTNQTSFVQTAEDIHNCAQSRCDLTRHPECRGYCLQRCVENRQSDTRLTVYGHPIMLPTLRLSYQAFLGGLTGEPFVLDVTIFPLVSPDKTVEVTSCGFCTTSVGYELMSRISNDTDRFYVSRFFELLHQVLDWEELRIGDGVTIHQSVYVGVRLRFEFWTIDNARFKRLVNRFSCLVKQDLPTIHNPASTTARVHAWDEALRRLRRATPIREWT